MAKQKELTARHKMFNVIYAQFRRASILKYQTTKTKNKTNNNKQHPPTNQNIKK